MRINNTIKELKGLISTLDAGIQDSNVIDSYKGPGKPISLSAERQKLIKELDKLKG